MGRFGAGLVAFVMACGGGSSHPVDSGPDTRPPADVSSPDTPSPDAPPQPVTLTILLNNAPVPGVTVYFQNVDSSLVARIPTDAQGVASTLMAPGGFVTAIDPFGVNPPNDDLRTFAGVKPGDQLVLSASRPSSTSISVHVVAPLDSDPSVASYTFTSRCGGGSLTPGTTTATGQMFLSGCTPAVDVLVLSYDNAGTILHYIRATVAAVDQGTVDLSFATYTAAATRTYTYSNPPTTGSLSTFDQYATTTGILYTQFSGHSVPGTGPLTFTGKVPSFPSPLNLVVTAYTAPFPAVNLQQIIDWGAWSASYSCDYGAKSLPTTTQLPAYDVATHELAWTEGAGALAPDAVLAGFSAYRSSEFRIWQWLISAPHSGTHVTYPTLPIDITDFNPMASDSIGAYSTSLFLIAAPGGYDALRPRLVSFTQPQDLVSGSTGSVTFTQLTGAP